MGEFADEISASMAAWIRKQKIFFVSSAPLDGNGRVNVSPKGYDALRVLGTNQVCYLELTGKLFNIFGDHKHQMKDHADEETNVLTLLHTFLILIFSSMLKLIFSKSPYILGSGIETQSHLEENGRITLMLCAFDGPPKIVRLWGHGRVVRVDTPEFDTMLEAHYTDSDLYNAVGKRAIIVVDVDQVGVSCGFAVPYMDFKSERPTHKKYWKSKTEVDVQDYWVLKNRFGMDGLPAMRHERMGPEWAHHKNKKSKAGNMLTNGSWLATLYLIGVGLAAGAALASIALKNF